MRKVLS